SVATGTGNGGVVNLASANNTVILLGSSIDVSSTAAGGSIILTAATGIGVDGFGTSTFTASGQKGGGQIFVTTASGNLALVDLASVKANSGSTASSGAARGSIFLTNFGTGNIRSTS